MRGDQTGVLHCQIAIIHVGQYVSKANCAIHYADQGTKLPQIVQ